MVPLERHVEQKSYRSLTLTEILVDPLAGVETNGYLVNWLAG